MPKKLAYHCSAMTDDHIYIHGGFEYPDVPNEDTFVLSKHTKEWKVISKRSGCGRPPMNFNAVCAIWKMKYLAVPTYNSKAKKSCTTFLDLKSKRWEKLKEDKRKYVIGGQIFK